jgi:WD40 repeat protein
VWDAKSGRLIHGPLSGHQEYVHFVAFSPDGRRIVSASHFGGVCIWDVDSKCILTASKNKTIQVYSLDFQTLYTFLFPSMPSTLSQQ